MKSDNAPLRPSLLPVWCCALGRLSCISSLGSSCDSEGAPAPLLTNKQRPSIATVRHPHFMRTNWAGHWIVNREGGAQQPLTVWRTQRPGSHQIPNCKRPTNSQLQWKVAARSAGGWLYCWRWCWWSMIWIFIFIALYLKTISGRPMDPRTASVRGF